MALLEVCDVTNKGRYLGFYQELEIRLKPREIVFFLCFTWTLHDFSHKIYFYCWKKLKEHVYSPKKWLDHLRLMTSHLVTMATDHHWTCLKMCARDEQTATENVRSWRVILLEKTQKNKGVASPTHPLCVRGLKWIRDFSNSDAFIPVRWKSQMKANFPGVDSVLEDCTQG